VRCNIRENDVLKSAHALCSAAPLAIAAILLAAPAAAQEAPAGDEFEIIVTVKDQSASLLDYPGSVRVVVGGELDALVVTDLAGLSYTAPNVSLDAIGTFKGVANFAIRGLGINSSIPSIDPAVGVFVDGVYQGINAGQVLDMVDVTRVDIVRGPQGVAFGRNTTGGAVLVFTADPEDEFAGSVRASYEGPVDGGRGGPMVALRGMVTGPLGGGFSFRLAGLHSDDGGYFRNDFDGEDFGGADTSVVRGGLAYHGDGLRLIAKVEWGTSEGDGAPTHSNGRFARDTFQIAVNQRGFYFSDTTSATMRAEIEVGEGQITNIFGWRDYRLATRNDIDSTPVKLFESDTLTDQEQWSNELTYHVDTGALGLVTGAYLFTQTVGYDEGRDLTGLGSTLQYGGGVQETEVFGLFGQLDYDLTEALTLSAGLRWSREEKSVAVTYVRTRAACSSVAGTCPITGMREAGENNGFIDTRAWEAFSPRFAASYHLTDDAQVYASWARGHRSGGYNLRITQPMAFEQIAAANGSPAFDEERVDTFEAGAKWQSEDGTAYLQGALFWTDVAGMQRELNVPSLTSGLAQSVYNTADARIRGGEVEGWLRPARGLTLSANIGLTDADYTDVFLDLTGDNAITAADLALALPRAPEWSWGGSMAWATPVSDSLAIEASAAFQHRSAFAYTDNNWGFNSASDRLDASLALVCESCGVTLRLYGRNLLDEVQFGGDTQLPFGGGPFSDGNNRPFDPAPAAGTFSPLAKGRVVGLELGVEF
jgi:iron complex outermembrane recepter protein